MPEPNGVCDHLRDANAVLHALGVHVTSDTKHPDGWVRVYCARCVRWWTIVFPWPCD